MEVEDPQNAAGVDPEADPDTMREGDDPTMEEETPKKKKKKNRPPPDPTDPAVIAAAAAVHTAKQQEEAELAALAAAEQEETQMEKCKYYTSLVLGKISLFSSFSYPCNLCVPHCHTVRLWPFWQIYSILRRLWRRGILQMLSEACRPTYTPINRNSAVH